MSIGSTRPTRTPTSYDETVQRNVSEQDTDARPAIANPLASITGYDTVLLGSPVWNVRPPMIMTTFTDSHDFTGKTILPFVTYAVSGLGRVDATTRPPVPGRGSVPAWPSVARRSASTEPRSRPGCARPGS